MWVQSGMGEWALRRGRRQFGTKYSALVRRRSASSDFAWASKLWWYIDQEEHNCSNLCEPSRARIWILARGDIE